MAEAGGRWVDRTARARAGGGVGKYPGLFAGFAGHGLAFLKLADEKKGLRGSVRRGRETIAGEHPPRLVQTWRWAGRDGGGRVFFVRI